jgi:prepilin-type N-terminal cleavage/methylation domain-containing protein/prepilin-type processing-associated H-X9-DG protein
VSLFADQRLNRLRQVFSDACVSQNMELFMRKNRGFTLIELLVVVAIIALLIAILLPSLGKARERANLVKCSTNMRSITQALLQYSDQNNGQLIIGQAAPFTTYPAGQPSNPFEFFWASEIVNDGYIKANSVRSSTGAINLGLATSSVFFCPKAQLHSGGSMNFPTDAGNFGWSDGGITSSYPVGSSQPVIYTWYMPIMKNMSNGNALSNTSSSGLAMPFVYWNSPSGDFTVDNGKYHRTMSMITRQSDTVMVDEGASNNIENGANATTALLAYRIGARHLDTHDNGWTATSNLAYFDGHVEPTDLTEIAIKGYNRKAPPLFYIQDQ